MSSETNPAPSMNGGDPDGVFAAALDLVEADPGKALSLVEAQLRHTPEPRLFRIAAEACRRLGQDGDAQDAELAAIQAAFRVPELNAAAIAKDEGRHTESRDLIERYLDACPDDLLALTMAAEADTFSWELEKAEARLRIVLGRAPAFLRAIVLLAKCLVLQARLKEGIDLVEEVVRRKPGNRTSLEYVAELHAEANDHEKAADVYARVVALDPNNLAMWILYAQQLRMLARKGEAIAAFRKALALDPMSGAAWWGLANYFSTDIGEGDVKAMERALDHRGGTAEEGGPLHVALGVLAERRGDFAEAFRHIAAGKRLRSASHPYDSAGASAHVDDLIQAFSADRFAAHGGGFPDEAPIFIIGMPRSGTTLLERILSCHSRIEAGGELPIMPRLHERLRRGSDGDYARRVASMSTDEFRRLGQAYVERSRDYRTSGKPRFIDKLNSNWLHVGLIRLMLPNAKIIDLRRDALDCCWSNFKMLFAEGNIASNDQVDIARYYRNYVRLVEAVGAASPDAILHVRYEDLVDNAEGRTREILNFLGLEYEPECMDFHRSKGAVATPSSEQVRRPINRDSIGSAGPYREWLGPMIKELGELAN